MIRGLLDYYDEQTDDALADPLWRHRERMHEAGRGPHPSTSEKDDG